MNNHLEEILRQFIEDVSGVYGDAVLAVVLYGSAASDDYVRGKSNINCLILLSEVTPQQLKKCSGYLGKWHDNGIATPLFIDPIYVNSSVDVFPIEFLDMKQRYRVLYGQDFLRDLQLQLTHLRFQCEQELKGKMLRLRQLYIERTQSPQDLTRLLIRSLSSFMVLFRALLHLRKLPAPQSAEEILTGLSQVQLRVDAMRKVYDLKRSDLTLTQSELNSLFADYLSEIQATIDSLEKMDVGAT